MMQEERMKNKREDNMKKLFVGGVLFDDITHACKNLTGELDQVLRMFISLSLSLSLSLSSSSRFLSLLLLTLSQEKFEELRKGRTENLLAFFLEFGEIQEVKPFWNDRHAFIVFSSEKVSSLSFSLSFMRPRAHLSILRRRRRRCRL
jgi:hypothetical protein